MCVNVSLLLFPRSSLTPSPAALLSVCQTSCRPQRQQQEQNHTAAKGHCLRTFLYPVAGGELNKVVLAGKLMEGGLGNIESIFNSLIKKQKETSINSF